MQKFRFLLAALLAIVGASSMKAQSDPEPYAVLDGTALTFYYDNQKASVDPGKTVYDFPTPISWIPGWASNSTITIATFDESFDNYTGLKDAYRFFGDLTALEVINHLEYLHTDNVTYMGHMFENCSSLTSLNLSLFNTEKVTNMQDMFYGCSNLETIYTADDADWHEVSPTAGMFSGCTKLSGKCAGNPFTFKSDKTDGTYAKVYKGGTEGGYFTSITERQAYAVLSDDGKTLTFYYDADKPTGAYDITWADNDLPDWSKQEENQTTIKTAVFDKSFGEYYGLTSTSRMFADLVVLETISNLKYLNTEGVTNMSMMFKNCKKLTSLDLSNFKVTSGTDMSGMFAYCSTLQTIYCPEETDWSGFSNNEGMFNQCINLSGKCGGREPFVCDGVNNINGTYAKVCTASQGGYFTSIAERQAYAVLDVDGETLTFYYDANKPTPSEGIEVYDIPWENFAPWGESTNVSKVKTASFDVSFDGYCNLASTMGMFYGLSSLTAINGLEYFHTQKVTNMAGMFQNCSSLTSLDLSTFNTENTTLMCLMFSGCESLKSLTLGDNFKTAKVKDMSYMFYYCKVLATLDLTNFYTANVTDMNNMFNRCSALETINWTSNFDTQNVTNMESMFQDCTSLESLDLSNFNTSRATNMFRMFSSCSTLQTLDLPRFYTVNVTNMNYMFYGCSALQTINWTSNFNTDKVTNMANMFDGCEVLASLDLSNIDTKNATDMSFMFQRCLALTSLEVGNFNTDKVTNMQNMFFFCQNLISLDVSNFNTENVTNMQNMFFGCEALKTIYCNEDWQKEGLTSTNMFAGCTSLKGGNGTPYDDSNIDVSNARPDTRLNPGYFTLKTTYGLQIGGIAVTPLNAGDLSSTNFPALKRGTVSYDINTNTLRIRNVTIESLGTTMDLYPIHFTKPGTLILEGENTLTTEHDPAIQIDADVTIRGDGSLTATSSWECGIFINSAKLTIQSCAVTAQSSHNSGIAGFRADGSLVIDGATVKASSENNGGSIFDLESFTLTNANITSPEGAVWNDFKHAVCNEAGEEATVIRSEVIITPTVSPYAVLEGTELKFYYNANKPTDAYDFERNMFGNFGWTSSAPNSNIRTVSFDESFAGYHDLTNASSMFKNMSGLTAINELQNFDTQNVTNMQSMFENCQALTSIELNIFNTDNVENMQAMFQNCQALTSLDLSNFNTDNVGNMQGMFSSCSSLTSLDLSKFNTSNVTNMQAMFSSCLALTSLDLSNFNTSNVENMQGVFYYCQALKTLKLSSNFVTTSAKYDMSNMFFNCKALTSLDLSSFVISSDVTDMHGMFYGCSNLETIFCVDDANWYNSNIDQRNMFDGCVKLKGKCGGREPFACDGSTNIEGDYARVCTPTQDGYFTSITERKGDANGDGEVNSGDVMAIYSVMAGNGTPEMQARADVNGDGHVDSGDIMAIYNIMAGN